MTLMTWYFFLTKEKPFALDILTWFCQKDVKWFPLLGASLFPAALCPPFPTFWRSCSNPAPPWLSFTPEGTQWHWGHCVAWCCWQKATEMMQKLSMSHKKEYSIPAWKLLDLQPVLQRTRGGGGISFVAVVGKCGLIFWMPKIYWLTWRWLHTKWVYTVQD